MALPPAAQGSPSDPGTVLLTAEEFGGRVQIDRVQTVRTLCAEGLVPGARKIGPGWRIHWPTFYQALAGPGVPEGEIVTSGQLARHLRVPERVVRRSSAVPGTPNKLPGLRLGKTWRYAMPAVHAPSVGWSQDSGHNVAVPAPSAAGPALARPVPPARFQSAQSLEYPATAPGQAPSARSPGRGLGAAARRRRIQPGPGHSPSPR